MRRKNGKKISLRRMAPLDFLGKRDRQNLSGDIYLLLSPALQSGVLLFRAYKIDVTLDFFVCLLEKTIKSKTIKRLIRFSVNPKKLT